MRDTAAGKLKVPLLRFHFSWERLNSPVKYNNMTWRYTDNETNSAVERSCLSAMQIIIRNFINKI